MIDTKNLRTLAEAAKGWGNCNQAWLDSSEDEPAAVVGHISEDGEKYPVVVVDCDQYYAAQDSIKLARFYAAANATTMLALLDALERKDAAIKKCYSEVIRGLADVVNVHTPDKLFDLDAIPRDPVMAIVSRIKTSMEAITKEIGA